MKIDYVNLPNMQGKDPLTALKDLHRHCAETAQLVMKLNNEVEELKSKIRDLERRH